MEHMLNEVAWRGETEFRSEMTFLLTSGCSGNKTILSFRVHPNASLERIFLLHNLT